MASADAITSISAAIIQGMLGPMRLHAEIRRRQQEREEQGDAAHQDWERKAQFTAQQRQQEQANDPLRQAQIARAQAQAAATPTKGRTRASIASMVTDPSHLLPGVNPDLEIESDELPKFLKPQPKEATPGEQATAARHQQGVYVKQREGTVKQLRLKMRTALRSKDMQKAGNVAREFDRIAGTHGTGDGVTEYRQALEEIAVEQRKEAARILNEESIRIRNARTRKLTAGGGGKKKAAGPANLKDFYDNP